MPRHFLTVANAKYYLQPGEDLDALAQRLLFAAGASRVVDVTTGDGRVIRVIATPGTPIVIETEVGAVAHPLNTEEYAAMPDPDQF